MAIERLVGLWITDDDIYSKYREEMIVILQTYGGGFSYDFKIAQTLKSETAEPINRLFTIYFKDESSMNSFFSNDEYLNIKKLYFEKSVAFTTEIARYQKKSYNHE